MASRTITGVIYHPGGNVPWVGAQIAFELMQTFEDGGRAFPVEPYPYSVTTGPGGAFTVDLAAPTDSSVYYRVYVGALRFDIALQAGPAITLDQLIALQGAASVTPDPLQAVLDTVLTPIGDLTTMPTTPKTSLAGAIGTTALGTTATTLSGAISEDNARLDAAAIAVRYGGVITAPTPAQAIAWAAGGVFNVKAFGAKGDFWTPDDVAIQAAIDAANAVGGGRVLFPTSATSYRVTGTLTTYPGISIEGELLGSLTETYSPAGCATIFHVPTVAGTHLFQNNAPSGSNYAWTMSFRNLKLTSNYSGVASGHAIHLSNPAWARIERVWVDRGFDCGVWAQSPMYLTIDGCFFNGLTTAGIVIVGERDIAEFTGERSGTMIGTTTYIKDTSVRGNPNTLWGIIVGRDGCLGMVLEHVTIENMVTGGIKIYKGNAIWLTNCYVENVPSTVIGAPIIELGKADNGPPADYDTFLHVTGGIYGGCNFGTHADSSFIDSDYAEGISIVGANIMRTTAVVRSTVNTKEVVAYGNSISSPGNWTHLNAATLALFSGETGLLHAASRIQASLLVAQTNVGIGTANPLASLHIKDISTTGVPSVRVENDSGATGYIAAYGSGSAVAGYANNIILGGSNSVLVMTDSAVANGGTHGISFLTGGYMPSTQTRMVIDSSGKVGIGTVSPHSRLDIDAGAMTLAEMTAPAAPADGSVVLYAVAAGGGKTKLMALFATGAAQQVALEP
jgi:Pectate lyase superfamily protein